jgi:carbon monoxide dehydrogenase subunit G
MKLGGTYRFNAPAEEVYRRLLDPEMLRTCMPGCERLEQVNEGRFELTLSVPIPAIKGEYRGTVEVVDREPPTSFRMKIAATGKSGFVNADARMRIDGEGESSTLSYDADAQIGGPAASVGQRVLTGISRRQVEQMMRCIDHGRPGRFSRLLEWLRTRFRRKSRAMESGL